MSRWFFCRASAIYDVRRLDAVPYGTIYPLPYRGSGYHKGEMRAFLALVVFAVKNESLAFRPRQRQ
jgi:hypothetical protein